MVTVLGIFSNLIFTTMVFFSLSEYLASLLFPDIYFKKHHKCSNEVICVTLKTAPGTDFSVNYNSYKNLS